MCHGTLRGYATYQSLVTLEVTILGLDVSTSIIGYTLLDNKGDLISIGHIDMTKLDRNVWTKAFFARSQLTELCNVYQPTHVFIEDPVSKFTKGKSSSHTIILLIRFNTLCSYFAMEASGVKEPQYITAGHARKLCDVKITKGGPKAKEQVFEHFRNSGPFKGYEWPLKRTGRVKDHCYDEVDSYVIAKAGFIELSTT